MLTISKAFLRNNRQLTKRISRSFSFLHGGNTVYMEQMYLNWLEDNSSVHSSWNAYFSNMNSSIDPNNAFISVHQAQSQNLIPTGTLNIRSIGRSTNQEQMRKLEEMIAFFRKNGHQIANLDPLNLNRSLPGSSLSKEYFKLSNFYSEAEQNVPISISDSKDSLLNSRESWTPVELYGILFKHYCEDISFDYEHINSESVKNWIQTKIEEFEESEVTKEVKEELLETILESQAFSDFCENKFSTLKRFGVDGLDSAIASVQEVVNKFHECEGNDIIIGMAHRGRLNTLTTVVKKPYEKMFIEFTGNFPPFVDETVFNFYGDVKYHMGYNNISKSKSGNEIKIRLLPNPSHLEAVNPVVLGFSKGLQQEIKDTSGKKVLPLIIHGDAAMAGQGINYEILQLEQLKNYSVGGSIHLIFNNQIGFTTDIHDSRSSKYSTSIGKANENLIIMVNANNPIQVRRAIRTAIDYRNEFEKDVYVDIIGYRKLGHNEQDNPRFTQPVMYKSVEAIKPMHQIYADKLISEGLFTAEEIQAKYDYYYKDVIETSYNNVKNFNFSTDIWNFNVNNFPNHNNSKTGVPESKLKELGEKIYNLDLPDFKIDNTIKRIYKSALKTLQTGKKIDWATAEHLAFATLLDEGHLVRLSGEDCERGTFSHRHSVIVDQDTNSKFFPISKILTEDKKSNLTISNSLLSEYGVMGYEFGYSLAQQNALTVWEAQFGDFANGGQIIIDQFLMNCEKKWRRFSGLVMLLPHGYDGMGPEHSNARIERFLMNVDDDFTVAVSNREYRDNIVERCNVQICNITSPANYFHCLRNQLKQPFRKPLVVFVPKKLLRYKDVNSDIEEFNESNQFKPILGDPTTTLQTKAGIKKVIICSGQVYYDLLAKRKEVNLQDQVSIIRLERIGPFAYNEFEQTLQGYNKNSKIVFVCEEQMNFSAFNFLEPRVNLMLKEMGFTNQLEYVGRRISGSSSTGISSVHFKEIEEFTTKALHI